MHADEVKAVRDYGRAALRSKPRVAKVLRHIRGEEKEHARELRKVMSLASLRKVKP